MLDSNVTYYNSKGQSIVLQGDGMCFLDVLPLFEYAWEYELTNSTTGQGGAAHGFARWPRTVSLELRLRGFTRQQFIQKMNDLQAITEIDALSETAGRLYVGNQYLNCFLGVAGSVPSAPRNANFATVGITVLAVRPFWCTDVVYTLLPSSAEESEGDAMAKKYSFKYPYRYATGITNRQIINTHYAPCPMILTIQGPVTAPYIEIGGNVYNVSSTVLATQRLIIDQTTRRIYLVGQNGAETNVFNARNKTHDIFTPIPVGESNVVYTGSYAVSITLVEQRSAPKWTD